MGTTSSNSFSYSDVSDNSHPILSAFPFPSITKGYTYSQSFSSSFMTQATAVGFTAYGGVSTSIAFVYHDTLNVVFGFNYLHEGNKGSITSDALKLFQRELDCVNPSLSFP